MRPSQKLRALALLAVAVALGAGTALLLLRSGDDPAPAGGSRAPGAAPGQAQDPFRYRPAQQRAFEQRAAAGLSHVLYARSPGGAIATAQRVAAWRPLIERAAGDGKVVDPDTLEAIVFLESAGRPDAQASTDLKGAVGLTQILAETATSLLGMQVDVRRSARLTRGINRGTKVAQRVALRRRLDERFDPAKALAGTVRYLAFARGKLGNRLDLAVESYHMGVGNLSNALTAYGEGNVPYAQLFFDATPIRHAAAWKILATLGDDSSTYLWRVLAAREIMRLYRSNPQELTRVAGLQTQKNSAENLLRPPASTPAYGDPGDVEAATRRGELTPLPTAELRSLGVIVDRQAGALAAKLDQPASRYHALRPEALAVLEYTALGVRAIAGDTSRLRLTSAVRDDEYQAKLVTRNIEATRGFSLHTTGYAFDIGRTYSSRAEAQAFQFLLDRLTALDVIAWVREPTAIHITAGPRAAELLRRTG